MMIEQRTTDIDVIITTLSSSSHVSYQLSYPIRYLHSTAPTQQHLFTTAILSYLSPRHIISHTHLLIQLIYLYVPSLLYPTYRSIYPIYLSIHPIYPSIHPVYLSTLSIYLSIHPIYLSIYPIYLSTLSIYLPYLSIHPVYPTMNIKSVIAGEYTAPPAHGPITREI